MNANDFTVSFVGTTQSGKTTALALLHLTANSMMTDAHRFMTYHPIPLKGDLDIIEIANDVKRGKRAPPTPRGAYPLNMEFVFQKSTIRVPLWGEKKVKPLMADVDGQSQSNLFALQSEKDLTDQGRLGSFPGKKIQTQDQDVIREWFMNCRGFVLVVDGTGAYSGEPTAAAPESAQDVAMSKFLTGLSVWKQKNGGDVKGIAVLLTKVDKIAVQVAAQNRPRDLPLAPRPDQLNQFMNYQMPQTMGQLAWFQQQYSKMKGGMFYYWLKEINPPPQDKSQPSFEVNPVTNTIVYPEQEFVRLVRWLGDL